MAPSDGSTKALSSWGQRDTGRRAFTDLYVREGAVVPANVGGGERPEARKQGGKESKEGKERGSRSLPTSRARRKRRECKSARDSARDDNSLLEAGAEADQGVDGDAHDEVHCGAPIGAEALVAQGVGQVGSQREVVDRVADEDRGEVFEPTSRSRA